MSDADLQLEYAIELHFALHKLTRSECAYGDAASDRWCRISVRKFVMGCVMRRVRERRRLRHSLGWVLPIANMGALYLPVPLTRVQFNAMGIANAD